MIRKIFAIYIVLFSMIVVTACGSTTTASPAIFTSTASFTQTPAGELPTATAAAESTATNTPSGAMQTPTPMGSRVEGQTEWDAIALQVAQTIGFTTSDSEIYQLPANTAWDATLAYYETQAAASGWGDAPIQTMDMAGGHAAVWSVNVDGTIRYFVVAQVDSVNGNFTLNLLGQ